MRRVSRGFSLVELIVVLVIVGILTAAGAVGYATVFRTSQDSLGPQLLSSAEVELRRSVNQTEFRYLPRLVGCSTDASLAGASLTQGPSGTPEGSKPSDFTISVSFPDGMDNCASSGPMSATTSTSPVVALAVKTSAAHCEAVIDNVAPDGNAPSSVTVNWDLPSEAGSCKVAPVCLSALMATWSSADEVVASRSSFKLLDLGDASGAPAACATALNNYKGK